MFSSCQEKMHKIVAIFFLSTQKNGAQKQNLAKGHKLMNYFVCEYLALDNADSA